MCKLIDSACCNYSSQAGDSVVASSSPPGCRVATAAGSNCTLPSACGFLSADGRHAGDESVSSRPQ